MSAPTPDERLDALRARYRRQRYGLLAVGLSLTATAALSSVRVPLLSLVLGAGLPGPLEIVPRHVPWSGYLEHDGGAVNDPALPMQVSFIGADGGTQWTESLVASVSDGGFSVELGETTPIPAAVLAANVLDLDVRVGAGLAPLPRQRLESVPYALRSGDVLAANRTFTVGAAGNFATLAEAFAWLQPKILRGAVTLQLLDGMHTLPAGGLRIDHPDSARIHVLGNIADPTQVVINATDQGFIVASMVYQFGGFRLVGSGAAGSVGIKFTDLVQGFVHDLQIAGFETSLQATQGARLYAVVLTLTGLGPTVGACLDASRDSHVITGGISVSSCQFGLRASDRSSISYSGNSIANVAEGAFATRGSYIGFEGVASQVVDAGIGQHATLHSTLVSNPLITFTNVTTEKDPLVSTVGNGNSIITQ